MKIDNLELKITFFNGLNERQKRHFAALEAKQLGHGGIKVVCESFGIDPGTVRTGLRELIEKEKLPEGRVRKPGGGRKKNPPGS